MVKFWPEVEASPVPADAIRLEGAAFDWSIELPGDAQPVAAAGAVLALVSGAAIADDPSVSPECSLDWPLSLWRARDGWLLVHTATRDAWRNFCATFLNRSAYREVAPERAWRDADINRLATIVLDTHRVDDAVGTCLTYQIPAAAVPGWRDRERTGAGRALGERLAWAALAPAGDGPYSITGDEVSHGRQSEF